jgi:hypothetical protein
MQFNKTVLVDLPMVYAITSISLDGKLHLMAATETHGECLLFSPPDWKPSVVWEGPGGTMNVVPVPGRRAVLGIQEFFPVFQSEGAGIVWAEPADDVREPWNVKRVLDLPFVHRIDAFESGGAVYLVAASLCGGKDFTDDWSRPGAVYVCKVPDDPNSEWSLQPVLEGVSKNHGLHVTGMNGRKGVLISGHEGMFAVQTPSFVGGEWTSDLLVEREISDINSCDLDGDGDQEIVTIEPFHGNRLAVYKNVEGNWASIFKWEIDFGHAIWAGTLHGQPSILVGNRGGDKELICLRVTNADPFEVAPVVLDSGVGPAQVTVVRDADRELILSANHGIGQVTVYEVRR